MTVSVPDGVAMEHPYTKLLEVLDGARYLRFVADSSLVYCWHGSGRVEVLTKEGACVDFFPVPPAATVEDVEAAIERHRAEDIA